MNFEGKIWMVDAWECELIYLVSDHDMKPHLESPSWGMEKYWKVKDGLEERMM